MKAASFITCFACVVLVTNPIGGLGMCAEPNEVLRRQEGVAVIEFAPDINTEKVGEILQRLAGSEAIVGDSDTLKTSLLAKIKTIGASTGKTEGEVLRDVQGDTVEVKIGFLVKAIEEKILASQAETQKELQKAFLGAAAEMKAQLQKSRFKVKVSGEYDRNQGWMNTHAVAIPAEHPTIYSVSVPLKLIIDLKPYGVEDSLSCGLAVTAEGEVTCDVVDVVGIERRKVESTLVEVAPLVAIAVKFGTRDSSGLDCVIEEGGSFNTDQPAVRGIMKVGARGAN